MSSFLLALEFLTIFPSPLKRPPGDNELANSTGFFPIIGSLIGGFLIGIDILLSFIFPTPVVNIFLILFLAIITGCLHLDGLADTIDGIGGGSSREDILRIMRDSRIGSFALIGMILFLLLKFITLQGIPPYVKYNSLLLMAISGRYSIVQLAFSHPYARTEEGKAKAYAGNISKKSLLNAGLFSLVASVILFGFYGILIFVIMILFTIGLGRYFQRRIGGITGDNLGAGEELNELMILLLILSFLKIGLV